MAKDSDRIKTRKLITELFGEAEVSEPETPPSSASTSSETERVDQSLVPEPLKINPPISARTETLIREFLEYQRGQMEANKEAIMATVARLESPAASSTPLRTLASEMKKKPSQRTLVPPTVEEKPVDPAILDLLLKKLETDGYKVSTTFATSFLRKHNEKLVPALKAVKFDIDNREATLHASGRVSIPQQTHEHANTPHLQTRDQLISFIETEDKQFRELAEKGWNSSIGHSLKLNGRYKNQAHRDEALAFYVQENDFRNERADYYRTCVRQGVSRGELETCMLEWEKEKREAEAIIPEESRLEQAAHAARTAAFSPLPSPSYQTTAEDEDESTEATPVGKVIIDEVIDEAHGIARKLRDARRQTGPMAVRYQEYDPFEKIASTAETFRMNAQVAAHEAAKSSTPETKEYEPDHMNQWNFPNTLFNALDSEEFYSEEPLLDCLKDLAERTLEENAKLREQKVKLKHVRINREAQRDADRFAQKLHDIINEPELATPHPGQAIHSLLEEISKMFAGSKPVTQTQMLRARRDVTKVMRQLYELLNESESEELPMNELREHMKGKSVLLAISNIFSEDNMKWLEPVFTDGMIRDLDALLVMATKVDVQITAVQQCLKEEESRNKARANINKPVKEFQEEVGGILTAVHDELINIPYNRPKLERLRLDMQGKKSTLADWMQEEWTNSIRGTIYDRIKDETIETMWYLIIEAAKDIDKNLKDMPKKLVAKHEEMDSLLYTILDLMHIPLLELLPREADVLGSQKTENKPEPKNEKGPYKSAVLRLFQEFDNLSEEHQSEILKTADRNVLVKELWNQPEAIQTLEEAALSNRYAGEAADESFDHVIGMQAYASRLLQAPLVKKLVAKKLQDEVRLELCSPVAQSTQKNPEDREDVPEELERSQESNAEHDLDVQKAIQDSLETEKTRKGKKPVSVSEGLRKKMAKAKIEKRLSEFVAGGAAINETGLKDGVNIWNEEHAIDAAEERTATADRPTSRQPNPAADSQYFIDLAVEWVNNKEKHGGKLPGHETCKCPAADHTVMENILRETAETAQKFGIVGVQKAAAQMLLASLDAEEEVAQSSAQSALSVDRKSKGKAQKKNGSNQTNSTVEASSSTSQVKGTSSRFLDGYDATPSGYTDAISVETGEPLDMETLRLHDSLLKLNTEIAAGSWSISEHKKRSRKYVVEMTGMETDWSAVALNICGKSAALAVAFVSAAKEEIKKYLVKKGLPTNQQWRIDYEGFRFGLRCQDHFANQLDICLGKEPRYPYGHGFATVENYDGVNTPTACTPPADDSSNTPTEHSLGDPAGGAICPASSTGVAPGLPPWSKPVASSSSSSSMPSASSSTTNPNTAPPSSNVSQLATIIENAARPTIDRGIALQIATMIEASVSTAAMEAANIPGLTAEMVSALASSSGINLPPNFKANIGAPSGGPSGAIYATHSDTTSASSSASLDTGSETTASASSDASKKRRPAVKKGARRR